ncbi:helix-turn-helix domain-containing protein [Kitasatospora sp. NPDC059646]|uniref:helix-turn-helix domain-containing protein n=1 Tax=Kitasatospora sp. NPDC059646 TaxID=3346893 RepID=UPI00368C8D6D
MDRFVGLVAGRTADPQVLAAAVRAARAASELVAALPEREVRRHTRALLDGVRSALQGDGEPGAQALAAAGALGSDRARQGVPVAALLDGFQAGRSHLVESVIAEGRRCGVPADELLDGVTRIDHITIVLARRMVQAHRVAELAAARTAREEHLLMLRQLLHGEAVETLGGPLSPAGRYRCVVTAVSDPALAGPWEQALSAAGPGLCGFVDGRLAALTGPEPRLPAGGPPAVVAPPVAPDALAPLYALARRALRAAEAAGLTGLHRLEDLALLTATPADAELGALLARSLLGSLDRSDPFHRELAATGLCHLAHGGRTDRTAAELHVHPNTVKYRLRRLRELTGGDPLEGGVEHTAHWWWALRSWLAPAGPGAGQLYQSWVAPP